MGLRVTIIQSNLSWENKSANIESFESKIQKIKGSDLIILPETFTTGFSMTVDPLAEEMSGESISKMREWSSHSEAVIVGSMIVKVVNRYFNRLIWMCPDGSYETYDKKHLFALGSEHKYFSEGDTRLITNLNGWRICPMICYDLRFPVWSRNYMISERAADYDLLFFIANWPAKRIDAWDTLLSARAIENQSYVIGVNRVGLDGNDIDHNGHSSVYDPMGERIGYSESKEEIMTIELDLDYVQKTRRTLPFLKDADAFKLLTTSKTGEHFQQYLDTAEKD